jgi:NTP pyrophosphatase (non-canonical NTP hydrolase)
MSTVYYSEKRMKELTDQLRAEMTRAQARYGNPASTHEALGVITEEYHELIGAIQGNRMDRIRMEALQMSAAALRLAEACEDTGFVSRSVK